MGRKGKSSISSTEEIENTRVTRSKAKQMLATGKISRKTEVVLKPNPDINGIMRNTKRRGRPPKAKKAKPLPVTPPSPPPPESDISTIQEEEEAQMDTEVEVPCEKNRTVHFEDDDEVETTQEADESKKDSKLDSGIGSQRQPDISVEIMSPSVYGTPRTDETAEKTKSQDFLTPVTGFSSEKIRRIMDSTYVVRTAGYESESDLHLDNDEQESSVSLLESSVDEPVSRTRDNYNITLFEEYDEGLGHRTGKSHSKWATSNENVIEQAFLCRPDLMKPVYTKEKGDRVFPPAPKYLLFPNATSRRKPDESA